MKSVLLPTWSYPFVLGLVGIVLFVGNLSPAMQAGIGVESLLFLSYVFWRARGHPHTSRPVANLLPLFPGHLLLLFALALRPVPSTALVVAWTVVPVATICYDIVTRWPIRSERLKFSLLVSLYCIIWADLFFLLERVIALGRNISGKIEIIIGAVFGVVGIAFLCLGAYRHWRVATVKE